MTSSVRKEELTGSDWKSGIKGVNSQKFLLPSELMSGNWNEWLQKKKTANVLSENSIHPHAFCSLLLDFWGATGFIHPFIRSFIHSFVRSFSIYTLLYYMAQYGQEASKGNHHHRHHHCHHHRNRHCRRHRHHFHVDLIFWPITCFDP